MTPPMLLRACPECAGRGRRPIPGLPGISDCRVCSGSGKVSTQEATPNADAQRECPHCGIPIANAPDLRLCYNCRRPLRLGAARVEEVK